MLRSLEVSWGNTLGIQAQLPKIQSASVYLFGSTNAHLKTEKTEMTYS